MPHKDVPEFMRRLQSAGSVSAMALEFCILTAARSGEVLNARWSEDKSAVMPRKPLGRARDSAVSVAADCAISLVPVYLSPQSVNKIPRLSLPENSRPKSTSQTSSRKCQ